MKRFLVFFALILLILGCNNNSTSPGDEYSAKLEVYYNNELIYNETLTESDDGQTVIFNLPDDSQITLEKFVNILYGFVPDEDEVEISRSYVIWAKIADYYTQFTSGSYLDTLQINASGGFTPVVPGNVCGTIYRTSHFPVPNLEFYIFQDSLIVDSLTTNANGHFAIDIPFGDYQIGLKCLYPEGSLYDFIVNSNYINYFLPMAIVHPEKPNIYIYPEEDITLDVAISFPHGGFVTESIPEYGKEWENLKVEPSGLINGKYNYLFYESANPDPSQYEKGWVIAREDLETFFIKNLAETGFEGQEIIDFTDYWLPLLKNYPYYAIYPQYNEQLDKIIQLNFSQKPDNILRLIYTLKGLQDNDLVLHEPEIPKFKREGFVVVEWGVIRKFENQNFITKNDNGK